MSRARRRRGDHSARRRRDHSARRRRDHSARRRRDHSARRETRAKRTREGSPFPIRLAGSPFPIRLAGGRFPGRTGRRPARPGRASARARGWRAVTSEGACPGLGMHVRALTASPVSLGRAECDNPQKLRQALTASPVSPFDQEAPTRAGLRAGTHGRALKARAAAAKQQARAEAGRPNEPPRRCLRPWKRQLVFWRSPAAQWLRISNPAPAQVLAAVEAPKRCDRPP